MTREHLALTGDGVLGPHIERECTAKVPARFRSSFTFSGLSVASHDYAALAAASQGRHSGAMVSAGRVAYQEGRPTPPPGFALPESFGKIGL